LYCNDGDWVESRSALVEHMDGHLEIINWHPDLENSRLGTLSTPAREAVAV